MSSKGLDYPEMMDEENRYEYPIPKVYETVFANMEQYRKAPLTIAKDAFVITDDLYLKSTNGSFAPVDLKLNLVRLFGVHGFGVFRCEEPHRRPPANILRRQPMDHHPTEENQHRIEYPSFGRSQTHHRGSSLRSPCRKSRTIKPPAAAYSARGLLL